MVTGQHPEGFSCTWVAMSEETSKGIWNLALASLMVWGASRKVARFDFFKKIFLMMDVLKIKNKEITLKNLLTMNPCN